MPTNVELKTLVNTDIRVKTDPNSILKGKVSDAIDAGYDYTDQEVSTLNNDVAVYFEDNVFGNYGAFTDESESSPYPFLNNRVNYMLADGAGSISLPDTDLVGLQIIVISAFAKLVYPSPDGSGTILNLASNTGAGGLNMLANRTYRFTYLGLHLDTITWTAELLGL